MIVKIENKEVELKYSFMSLMLYEQITGKAFTMENVSNLITYLFCTIIASDDSITMDFKGFVKWMDENPDVLNEFVVWLTEKNKMAADLKKTAEKVETTSKKKLKK